MKILSLFFAVLVTLLPHMAAAAPAKLPICLQAPRIDHTTVPDDTAILFHMHNHHVYRAAMNGRCIGLSLDTRGFTYAPTPGSEDICGNLFSIKLNTSGQICMVGDIMQIK